MFILTKHNNFVKINIYYQSKYLILQFLGASPGLNKTYRPGLNKTYQPGLDKTYHKFRRLSGLNKIN